MSFRDLPGEHAQIGIQARPEPNNPDSSMTPAGNRALPADYAGRADGLPTAKSDRCRLTTSLSRTNGRAAVRHYS